MSQLVRPKFLSESDYREILKYEYTALAKQQPDFSQRNFAKHLGLSTSTLNEVFKGRTGLSRTRALDISKRLAFSEIETEIFCSLVESKHARNVERRTACRREVSRLQDQYGLKKIPLNYIEAISDWRHFAILEAIQLRSFDSKIATLANMIKDSKEKVQEIIDRLKGLNLLEIKNEVMRPAQVATEYLGEVPSSAVRAFHRGVIQRALTAIDEQTVDERELSSNIIAIETKDYPKAKKMIRDFQREFCLNFGNAEKKDKVYCLTVQFFDLMRTTK